MKILTKLSLSVREPHNTVPLLGDTFKVYFIENKGAAFGLSLDDALGPEAGARVLAVFSLALVALVGWFLWRVARVPTRLPLFVALILGGAVGNLLDRLFYGVWFAARNDYEGGWFQGRVVDMLYIDIWKGYVPDGWPLVGGNYYTLLPVFNLADVAITLGILAVLVFQRRLFRPLGQGPAC